MALITDEDLGFARKDLPPITPAEVSRMRRDMFAQLERWRALGLIPSEAECEEAYTVHRDPGPAKL